MVLLNVTNFVNTFIDIYSYSSENKLSPFEQWMPLLIDVPCNAEVFLSGKHRNFPELLIKHHCSSDT